MLTLPHALPGARRFEDVAKVRGWSQWLRRVLLAEMLLHLVWVVASGVDKGLIAGALPASDPDRSGGCIMRAFIESYTMAFHQAFILAVGYAQAFTNVPENRRPVILYFIAGCGVQTMAFGVVLYSAPHAWTVPKVMLCLCTAMPLVAASVAGALFRSLDPATQPDAGEPREIAAASGAGPTAGTNEVSQEGTTHTWPTLSVVLALDRARIPGDCRGLYDAAARTWRAMVANCVLWQVQGFLALVVDLVGHRAADNDVAVAEANRAMAASMKEGINWGLHGSGITVFTAALAFWHPKSWPFFRTAVIMGAVGGSVQGVLQAVRVVLFEGVDLNAPMTIICTFFLIRAAVGATLAEAFGRLPLTFHADVERMVEAAGRGCPPKTASATSGRSGPGAGLMGLVFIGAAIVYAVGVASFLAPRYGNASRADPHALEEEEECAADRCTSAWRVGASPPAYTLLFHFAYIVPSFCYAGTDVRFPPSAAIGYGFCSSALFIATVQVVLLAAWAPQGSARGPLSSFALAMIMGSIAMLSALRRTVPVSDPAAWGRPEDPIETAGLLDADDGEEDLAYGKVTRRPTSSAQRFGTQVDFW